MEATQIATLYQRLPDFSSLVSEFDPNGQFINPYLDRVLFGNHVVVT
jgi:hypothetical protein